MRFSPSALQPFTLSRRQIGVVLRSYFYSGWAFLIPYLFFYLLYYATGWPVNGLTEGVGSQKSGVSMHAVASGAVLDPTLDSSLSPLPCLLHVYWALHALHVILAGAALWSWMRERRRETGDRSQESTATVPTTACSAPNVPSPLPASALQPFSLSAFLIRLAPWLLLALIFYIPGVYLEWPSDPWEHLRRINEWRILDAVGAHSSWYKSSYFIPYSLLSWCIGLRQLFWLDFYYTGICLLLCWQYYRLSRACGLSDRASMVFVIIQALLFGNNIFSFYRYYGISSSIYAQIGAIALTRLVLEWASFGKTNVNHRDTEHSEATVTFIQPFSSSVLQPFSTRPAFWHLPSLFWLLTSVCCLLVFTALNHVQGLGIAGLGITAVSVWRLIEWKRSALWWLIGTAALANILFLKLYPRPSVLETYRAQGWLNGWYGINFTAWPSAAADRTLQILSIAGLANLAAAVFLVFRRSIVGWLTLLPLITLALPVIAIPFVLTVTQHSDATNVLTFQRMLLAVPTAMSIAHVCGPLCVRASGCLTRAASSPDPTARILLSSRELPGTILIVVVATLVTAPPGAGSYNRAWHSLTAVAKDLELGPELEKQDLAFAQAGPAARVYLLGNKTGTSANVHTRSPIAAGTNRIIGSGITDGLGSALEALATPNVELQRQPIKLISRREPRTNKFVASSDLTSVAVLEDWISLIGNEPIVDHPNRADPNGAVLRNAPGDDIFVFSRQLVIIDRGSSYKLSISTQQASSGATAYLAIAWYDKRGSLLPSHAAQPDGAGAPAGWSNGTYSYFGLTGQEAPREWTTYTVTFGAAHPAVIPSNAAYFRVGALLNYNKQAAGVVQISRVRLDPVSRGAILSLLTREWGYDPRSQAGMLSAHWPANQVAVDRGGTRELLEASERLVAPHSSRAERIP